ncbi:MAG TPA: hypothetical protein DCZ34_03000 [Clostridiales bacterium]|nr:hypothetical protein [Clostridiales bacterium]
MNFANELTFCVPICNNKQHLAKHQNNFGKYMHHKRVVHFLLQILVVFKTNKAKAKEKKY